MLAIAIKEAVDSIKNLANCITCSRILFALCLVIAAPFSFWFWFCYLCGGLSDMLDGWVARTLHQQSALGAALDSIADMAFAAAILVFAITTLHFSTWMWVAAAGTAAIRIASYLIGLCKFKTLPSLHTYANKATGALVFAFPLLHIVCGTTGAGILLCLAALVSSLEELLITVRSRELRRDRKSIFLQ